MGTRRCVHPIFLTEKGREEAEKLFAEVEDDAESEKVIDQLQMHNSMPLMLLLKVVRSKLSQYLWMM